MFSNFHLDTFRDPDVPLPVNPAVDNQDIMSVAAVTSQFVVGVHIARFAVLVPQHCIVTSNIPDALVCSTCPA